MIMDGVFASYISRLTDEYTKIETMSPKVKETMLIDAKHITDKLSQLSGVRPMDQGLIQSVEAREVSTSDTNAPLDKSENGHSSTKKSDGEVLFDASENEKNED